MWTISLILILPIVCLKLNVQLRQQGRSHFDRTAALCVQCIAARYIFLAFFQLGTDNRDVATVTRPEDEKRCWGDSFKK